jgi:hypothetical protein
MRINRLPPLLLLALAAVGALACAHDFTLENRETPVHVWLSAPDLQVAGGEVDVLIYVGAEKVVEGPVRFPPGVASIVLPTVFVTAGKKTVSAVVRGGTSSATREVGVPGEMWVQILVRGRTVTISSSSQAPYLAR